MPEWPKPHMLGAGISYLPVFVTLKQVGISWPGTASCLKRRLG